MRYFVIGEDGSRYGPADEALLESWAREGRITPHSYLEAEHGGNRLLASSMPNLQFPTVTAQYMPPAAPRPSYGMYMPTYSQPAWTASEVRIAWYLAVFAIVMDVLCQNGMPFAVLAAIAAAIGLFRGKRAGPVLLFSLLLIAAHFLLSAIAR